MPERRPTRRDIDRASEQLWVDESLRDEHRMTVAFHPVTAEACRHARQHGGAEIGCGSIGQEQKAGVVDHQGKSPPPLFVAPADPLIAVAQAAGCRREEQHAKPVAIGIKRRIPKPFTDWIRSAQIVVCGEQFSRPLDFLARGERLDANVTQQTLAGWPIRWMVRGGEVYPAIRKNPGPVVQHFDSKCLSRMFWKCQRIGAGREGSWIDLGRLSGDQSGSNGQMALAAFDAELAATTTRTPSDSRCRAIAAGGGASVTSACRRRGWIITEAEAR